MNVYREIAIEEIFPDPEQPRRVFDPTAIEGLAASVRTVGVLCPITVAPSENGYRIIAGERRWRAAKEAGLTRIPCLVRPLPPQEAALAALIENLQREDLDCFEEAEALRRILVQTGLTQAALAEKLGRSPSCLANKLRLLSLSSEIRQTVRQAGLTERHARLLLPLPPERREAALLHIAEKGMKVEAAERYVSALLTPRQKATQKPYIKDIRLFLNTVEHAIRLLTAQGVPAQTVKKEDDARVIYTVTIPKTKAE